MCVNVNAFSLNTWQCILCNVLGVSYSSAIANGCTQCHRHLSLGNCKRANCRRFLLSRFARRGIRQQQQKNVVTIKLFSNSVLCVRWSEDPIFYLYNTILQVGRGTPSLHFIRHLVTLRPARYAQKTIWWRYVVTFNLLRPQLSENLCLTTKSGDLVHRRF